MTQDEIDRLLVLLERLAIATERHARVSEDILSLWEQRIALDLAASEATEFRDSVTVATTRASLAAYDSRMASR